jgi:hypothetical protein
MQTLAIRQNKTNKRNDKMITKIERNVASTSTDPSPRLARQCRGQPNVGLDPSPKKQTRAVTDNGLGASKGVKDDDDKGKNAFDKAETVYDMNFESEGTGDGV